MLTTLIVSSGVVLPGVLLYLRHVWRFMEAATVLALEILRDDKYHGVRFTSLTKAVDLKIVEKYPCSKYLQEVSDQDGNPYTMLAIIRMKHRGLVEFQQAFAARDPERLFQYKQVILAEKGQAYLAARS